QHDQLWKPVKKISAISVVHSVIAGRPSPLSSCTLVTRISQAGFVHSLRQILVQSLRVLLGMRRILLESSQIDGGAYGSRGDDGDGYR
ncbi:hypothetical protein Droror1_Dr00027868, partial [Drosera rotundifolia]